MTKYLPIYRRVLPGPAAPWRAVSGRDSLLQGHAERVEAHIRRVRAELANPTAASAVEKWPEIGRDPTDREALAGGYRSGNGTGRASRHAGRQRSAAIAERDRVMMEMLTEGKRVAQVAVFLGITYHTVYERRRMLTGRPKGNKT